MKDFYNILNLIIIIILILVLILYITTKSFNMGCFNKLKEAFQDSDLSDDIETIFFDLSSNYFTLTPAERGTPPPPLLDEVILDIGGAFGDIDASRIPWDAENKELLPSEALYGTVPSQVSSTLFSKMNEANQLGDIQNLPMDETTNNIMYQSPEFQQEEGAESAEQTAFDISMQVATVLATTIMGEIAESYADAKIEKNAAKKAGAAGDAGKGAGKGAGAAGDAGKAASKTVVPPVQTSAAKGVNLSKVDTKAVSPKKFGKFDNLKFSTSKVNKMASKAGSKGKNSAKMLAMVALKAGKKMTKLINKLLIFSMVLSMSLKIIPVVGPTLATIYDMVITPIVLVLSLSGVIDGAISKAADPEGCCPNGSKALDLIIPAPVNDLLLGNIPIIGDIFGFFYPYVCSEDGTGKLTYKITLTTPKYISYQWLTSYHFSWPEYNCRGGLTPRILGKKFTGSGYEWNNGGLGPYTDMNRVIADHRNFSQTMRKLVYGKIEDSEIQYILTPSRPFFYADFTEPKMLIDMAQFYYNWAINDPYPNDDGTVTIEYISKINYIAASSLYTCDAMCEMVSITFDPLTGTEYSETVTFDRDRRFYYRVNPSQPAPNFWENSANTAWTTLDDRYDLAVNDLNNYIYQNRFNNSSLNANILLSAYRQELDTKERLEFITQIATSNYAKTGIYGTFDQSIIDFNIAARTARDTLTNLQRDYLSGVNSNDNSNIRNKLSTIVGLSNELWNFHKGLPYSSIDTYRNNQYRLSGCTKVDATASSAAAPDPSNLEEDVRYFTNFNVLPYIKRCNGVNMNINKCIDPSNIELIIYNYYIQNENKRIKTIHNIKAKGRNACEFTWDEVEYNSSTRIETNFKSKVQTTVLYQQDLSSCTFDLPPPVSISGRSNYLFGSQSSGVSIPIVAPPSSLKIFKNPIESTNTNFSDNITLEYKPAKYKYPIMPTPAENNILPANQKDRPKGFIESNVDYIPRYNPATFVQLPTLVRPKKPIRVKYPNDDQSTLGNQSNNYCSDPRTLSNIVLNYNGDSNNPNKIATIIRTFTSSSNTCDLEVDMYIKDTKQLERKTISIDMRVARRIEPFQNPYTYSSLNSRGGLNIDASTEPLSNSFKDGFGYQNPYLNEFTTSMAPNTVYFNDNLIKSFTSKTKSLRDTNYRMIQGLVGTQHLGGSNCNTKCNEDEIVQRIIEQYNKDGLPLSRYDVEKNSIRQVVNSVTNSSNTCHVILDNRKEYYGDFYSNDRTSSNYDSEYRLKLKKVHMEDAGNCTFYPTPAQEYIDISASDLALTSSSNFHTYKKPKRVNCPPVNCRNTNLYTRAFNDYKEKTGNTLTRILKSMNVTENICDYLIESQLNINDELLDIDEYVLRVTYSNTLYESGMTSNCTTNNVYTYNPDNFTLEVGLDLSDIVENPIYYNYVGSDNSNSSNASSPLLSHDQENSDDPIRFKVNTTRENFLSNN
jgi:hypothetical protein